jgi:hypothetical protein
VPAGADLKSSGSSEPWDDLKMPEIIFFIFPIYGGRLKDIVIIRVPQETQQSSEKIPKYIG